MSDNIVVKPITYEQAKKLKPPKTPGNKIE